MGFLRRLFGSPGRDEHVDSRLEGGEEPVRTESDIAASSPDAVRPRPEPMPCPYCATLLDPPPARDRLCPRCRQRIVVRRIGGRLALLTTASVAVFEAQRRRSASERAWTATRARWLRLAGSVGADPARRAKLAAAPISAAAVAASRSLYLNAANRAATAARREKRWGDIGRVRREQAEALFSDADAPVPPPEEVVALHREGMAAVLRSLQQYSKEVELVSAGCCPPCRTDDGRTFLITDEMRTPRLPHAGCPRGLCGCDWWPAVTEARGRRRRQRQIARPGASSDLADSASGDTGPVAPVESPATPQDGSEA